MTLAAARGSVLLAVAMAAGCNAPSAPYAPGHSIGGTVTYAGTGLATRTALTVAVWTAWPPTDRPIAYQTIHEPLPTQAFFIEGLPPGDYYVGAAADLDEKDTPHPYMLNPRVDPHGYFPSESAARPARVQAEIGAASVDFTVTDVPPGGHPRY